MTIPSGSALTQAFVSPAPTGADVRSRPSVIALASLNSSSSPSASSRDQAPVPRLGACGSPKKRLGMWVLRPPPPSGARLHAVRGSLTVHIASRLTSYSCSRPLCLQSHQWQSPPPWSPAHRGGANFGLSLLRRGSRRGSGRGETRRALTSFFSAGNIA